MKTVFRRIILTACFLLLICLIAFVSAPSVLNKLVLPALLKKNGLEEQTVTILQITPYSLTGMLNLDSGSQPGLAIPRFEVHYDPSSLLHKRARSLTVDHAAVHIYRDNGRYVFGGFSPLPKKHDPAPPAKALLLPIAIDRVELRQCSLVFHNPAQTERRIVLDVLITPDYQHDRSPFTLDKIQTSFNVSGDLEGAGSLSVVLTEDEYSLELALHDFSVPNPDLFLPLLWQRAVSGTLTADILMTLEAGTMKPLAIKGTGAVENLRGTARTISFRGANSGDTLEFSVVGSPAGFEFSLGKLALKTPLTAHMMTKGTGSIENGILSLAGVLESETVVDDVNGNTKLPANLSYKGQWSAHSGYRLTLTANDSPSGPISFRNHALSVAMSDFQASGTISGAGKNFEANLDISTPAVQCSLHDEHLNLDNPAVSIQAVGHDGILSVNLTSDLERLELPGKELFGNNIHLNLPMSVGSVESADQKDGSLSIGAIGLHGTSLASVDAVIGQHGELFRIKGAIQAAFSQETTIAFNGEVNPRKRLAGLEWNLNQSSLKSGSLPKLPEIPQNIDIEANIEGRGTIRYSDNNLAATASASVTGGTLHMEEQKLDMTGVNCSLDLPALPAFISAPSQKCSIGRIDLGTLHFADTRITFRLEDSKTVFIERSKTKWCRGSLESGSLRFSLDKRELDTVLYCSRLNFTDLLNQFGLNQTEGEGTVNGKLPISYMNKRLTFDDGFLFSTPGTGGIVRFSNTDLLRQSMGTVEEAGYLSYSLKALEDFAYNWSRLSFNSSGNDLLMSLELDGKPNSTLPYAFKNGMIIETEEGKGLQYPLRLDINFRLPLTELFQVGQNIKSIMGNQ